MERKQCADFSAAGDFLLEIGIPPQVINIRGDAYVGRSELFAHVVGLTEGVHRRAAVGIHGMKRLDAELHAGCGAVVEHGGDAVGDLLTGFRQRLTGDRAAYENDEGRTKFVSLGDGAAIVIDRCLAFGGGGAGEKTSAAGGDDGEIVVTQHLAGGGDVTTGVGVTPNGDAFYPGGGVFFGRGFNVPRLGRDGVDAKPVEVG